MGELAIRPALDGRQTPVDGSLVAGPAFTRFCLRANGADLPRIDAALGFSLPKTACRSASLGARHALWLGPDEWLLLCDPDDPLGADLAAVLSDTPHALVEVSCRQTALLVQGLRAVDLLSAGCPLDLALSACPIGMCTRTVFAKAEIVLWRTGETAFHVEVWRSFAGYVWAVLQAGAAP